MHVGLLDWGRSELGQTYEWPPFFRHQPEVFQTKQHNGVCRSRINRRRALKEKTDVVSPETRYRFDKKERFRVPNRQTESTNATGGGADAA